MTYHILVAATAMEMRSVFEGSGLDCAVPERGRKVLAMIGSLPVYLVVSGIGPLAAAAVAGELLGEGLLENGKCRGICNFGIAGTYSPMAAPLGSIVLASQEVWPEYGLRTERGVSAEELGFPLLGTKNEISAIWNVIDLNPEAALGAMGLFCPGNASGSPDSPRVVTGPSITVAGVSGTPAIAKELGSRHAALSENMEGFSLALASLDAGVPFAEIRAVSNIAGARDALSWNIPAALGALSRAVALIFAGRPENAFF